VGPKDACCKKGVRPDGSEFGLSVDAMGFDWSKVVYAGGVSCSKVGIIEVDMIVVRSTCK
jgi:hypothetical protein